MSALVEVTHIEDITGPKGGRYWWLTLACGHFKSVHQPAYPASMVPIAHKGNRDQEKRQRRLARMSAYCAPHRVKCMMGCKSGGGK